MATSSQQMQFQAETRHLLDLMIHSLYTSKDIFLRELISNASDALDRLRYESLTQHSLMEPGERLEIRLDADPATRTLTISDNGIGMSREEVINNIGTIAKSGTRELRERLQETPTDEQLTQLIGKFGVGFYSAFMVAERVTLVTCRAGEELATRWESTGEGEYTIAETEKEGRGTSITLHLRPVDPEQGIEDYTDRWVLSRIVKRYSDFVSYAIIMTGRREGGEERPSPEATETAAEEKETILNTMKPLWARSPSEVKPEEYADFYRHVSHSFEEPLATIHIKAEGTHEYRALLFIPRSAPRDLYYHAAESGLRLYAKGVLIIEHCEELTSRYLRFVKGVVDSADLPLNISRQMLQQDRHVTRIRKWITKRVLDELASLRESDGEKYLELWKQFGRAIKEGVSSDSDNRDKIISLLLFESSHDPAQLTTLKDYVGRMKEEQTEIFYLTGESRSVVEHSPHLEAFRENGYEVLYLTDPVDELLVQALPEFEGHRLKSAAKGVVKLGDEEERRRTEEELKEKETEAAGLLGLIQQRLDADVKQVRLTNRLTASPACLVAGAEHDDSPYLERLLQRGKGGGPKQRRILELNPRHAIFEKMQERYRNNADDPLLGQYAGLLLGCAFLAEGSELPDHLEFTHLMVSLMEQAL